MSEYPVTSTRGQEMMSYLPRLYETSRVMRANVQAKGEEFDKLRQALDETLDQFFVQTATWGLDRWEYELGINSPPGKTEEERRSAVLSKLRGYGTATIRLAKQVAESFGYGTINIIEDFPSYSIVIRFVDTTGVPSNIEDIKAALQAVIPAHLSIEFEFKYFTWNELDAKNWTWDQLDSENLTWDELEVYNFGGTTIVRDSLGLTFTD